MSEETDWAWAAGLFEGEGCISSSPATEAHTGTRQLKLVMTDRDVVERFHSVVGVGNVLEQPMPNPKWKTQWAWRCGRWDDIETILHGFLRFLGERRRKRALEFLADPPRGGRYRTHCKHGHEFTPENTVPRGPNGEHRNCRICRRASARKYEKKRLEAARAA